ncbi:ATP-binding protein [Fictibacillus terranigra]
MKLDSHSAHYLFQVILSRYERGSIILTSTKGFGERTESPIKKIRQISN